MKSQSWMIASDPANRPAPIERAGFTDVPVSGISAKWIIARDRPIAIGARPGCSLRSSVTERITSRKIRVATASTRNAAHHARPLPLWSPKAFCPKLPSELKPGMPCQITHSTMPPRMPPMSWASM